MAADGLLKTVILIVVREKMRHMVLFLALAACAACTSVRRTDNLGMIGNTAISHILVGDFPGNHHSVTTNATEHVIKWWSFRELFRVEEEETVSSLVSALKAANTNAHEWCSVDNLPYLIPIDRNGMPVCRITLFKYGCHVQAAKDVTLRDGRLFAFSYAYGEEWPEQTYKRMPPLCVETAGQSKAAYAILKRLCEKHAPDWSCRE